MQAAKDSFYKAWRDRLSEVNPERTVVVEGALRPAIVVAENEASDVAALDGTFRVQWGACAAIGGGSQLMKVDCTVSYTTRGADGSNADRGRTLSEMDGELLAVSQPPRTMKMDYSVIPARSQGTMLFWTDLEFGAVKDDAGRISREAKTTVYFRASGTSEVKP